MCRAPPLRFVTSLPTLSWCHRQSRDLAASLADADIRNPSSAPATRAPAPQIVTASKPAPPLAGFAAPVPADLEKLRPGLRIIALRALGDLDLADEAVQETIARAVAALAERRLEDPTKLAGYVAGIARHVCTHVIRDRKQTVAADDELAQIRHPQLQTTADPLEALITAAEVDRLRTAFSALTPDDQQLLRLCFHEDRTPNEIAAALGEPAERIRKRKSRALERLRRAFLGADTHGHDAHRPGTETVAPLPTERTDDHD